MRLLIETIICPFCGTSEFFELDFKKYVMWTENRLYIEDAMPELTNAERERFISGVCGDCWNEIVEEIEDV